MIAAAWETRVAELLVFHYEADSFAQSNLDAIVDEYQKALAEATAFLGMPRSGLPKIDIYLCPFLADTDGQSEAGCPIRRDPEAGELWTTVNSESPGANAAEELTQFLLP